MEAIDIWRKCNLFSRKIASVLLLLAVVRTSVAQINVYEHDQKYLERSFHFGISMALNRANYKITLDSIYLHQGEIRTVKTLDDPGFSLGILSDLHLSRSFELRFIPDLAFADRSIEYTLASADSTPIKKIESVYLEFPVHLKYRSHPYKDMRVYVIGGIKYSIDMQSNASARLAENLVKVYKNDVSAEYGLGLEFHLPLVVISPEIKVSYGLTNVLKPDDNLIYSRVLQGLRTRAIMFTIHFEG